MNYILRGYQNQITYKSPFKIEMQPNMETKIQNLDTLISTKIRVHLRKNIGGML